MKKIFITMLVCFTTAFIFATTTNITDDKKTVEKKSQNIQVVAHSVINFTDLAKKAAETKTKDNTNIQTQVIPINKWHGQQIPPEDIKKIKKKAQLFRYQQQLLPMRPFRRLFHRLSFLHSDLSMRKMISRLCLTDPMFMDICAFPRIQWALQVLTI